MMGDLAGKPRFNQSPSIMCRFERHTPQALTLANTSPLLIIGLSMAANLKGLLSIGAVLSSNMASKGFQTSSSIQNDHKLYFQYYNC